MYAGDDISGGGIFSGNPAACLWNCNDHKIGRREELRSAVSVRHFERHSGSCDHGCAGVEIDDGRNADIHHGSMVPDTGNCGDFCVVQAEKASRGKGMDLDADFRHHWRFGRYLFFYTPAASGIYLRNSRGCIFYREWHQYDRNGTDSSEGGEIKKVVIYLF